MAKQRGFASGLAAGMLALGWSSALWAANWSNVGPSSIAFPAGGTAYNGRIMSVAVDPSNTAHWLVNADTGGLWETHSSGASWTARSDSLDSLFGGPIAFARSNPSIAYAASTPFGAQHAILQQGGFLKSTDGGATWAFVARAPFVDTTGTDNMFARGLAVDGANPQNLVAALSTVHGLGGTTLGGIFKSTDGGATWARKVDAPSADVKVLPSDFSRQYAGVGVFNVPNPTASVFRSMDAGATWQSLSGPWAASQSQIGEIIVAFAPSDINTAYVAITKFGLGNVLGFWKTSDAWDAAPQFTTLPNPSSAGFDMSIVAMTVDPSSSSIVYAGGGALLGRFSGGAWTEITGNSHVDFHALAFAGSELLAANDGGIFGTTTGGPVWTPHNTNLSVVQFYRGSVHPGNSAKLLGGSQDNGVEARLLNQTDPNSWSFLSGGDGFSVFFSGQNPDAFWGLSENTSILRTLDGGTSIQGVNNNIPAGDLVFPVIMERSPANDNIVLVGGTHLDKSTNFFASDPTAVSWARNEPAGFSDGVASIAFAPADPNGATYALGTASGKIYVTQNGGGSWQLIASSGAVPARPVSGLAFDSLTSNVLLACLDGIAQAGEGQVYRTANAFSATPSWANLGAGTSAPHHAILIDPLNHNNLYVGTDFGVFQSPTGGGTWTALGTAVGLPNRVIVNDVRAAPNGDIAAFSYGRGAFRLAVGAAPIVPIVSAAVDAATSGVVVSSGSLVDSYLSCNGAYGGGNVRSHGNVQAAQSVTLNAGAVVHGSLLPNDPSGFTPFPMPAGLVSSGDLNVNPGATVTLAAGDYLFRNVNVNTGGKLATTGRARLWFTGSLTVSGVVQPAGGLPGNVWFFSTTGSVSANVNSGAQVTGVLFAPNLPLAPGGTPLLGAVVGSTVDVNGTQLHYDETLGGASCGP
jgi:hypothetical protein